MIEKLIIWTPDPPEGGVYSQDDDDIINEIEEEDE